MEADISGTLEHLVLPPSTATALVALAGPVRRWFCDRFGGPTPAQRLAWPSLAGGKHLLVHAPTGSGKTLAAFLPILSQMLTDRAGGGVRCLYLSPLKALANDAAKNLKSHLAGIQPYLDPAGPGLRVGVRTGDTPHRGRRDLWLNPPEILLTTPESLAVLLTQPGAADLVAAVRWVVVDEVHALASNKRGADLALSLERLSELGDGRLQRVGLSATCTPVTEAARFLAGVDRACSVAHVSPTAPLQLTVEPLGPATETDLGPTVLFPGPGRFLARLIDRLEVELLRNRTTLIFTNTRGLAERLVWGLRRRFPQWAEQLGVHHSSVALTRRRLVEQRLKAGELRGVVSSTSLELGVDIGSVDGVVLVHPPGGVVRLLQRVGRGGHEPDRPRRGLVLTANPAELLEATVTGASCRSAQYEPFRVPSHPLDVLCQQLLGLAAERAWSAEEAFDVVRRAHPYRDLSRSDLDHCLDYLSGRRQDGSPWLPARLRWDGDRFSILDERTARLLRRNIGTILTDEPRQVQLLDAGPGAEEAAQGAPGRPGEETAVGEVDNAFADRLQPGDRFLLDGRCLEYRRSNGQALLVAEVAGRPMVPRWDGHGVPLSAELARRLYLLRMQAAEALRDGLPQLRELLRQDYGLDGPAAGVLVEHFQTQECVSEIPDTATFLIEVVGSDAGASYYCHTPLNRAANDALARVVVLRCARDHSLAVTSCVADLGFALATQGARGLTPDDVPALLAAQGFDADLHAAVADSGTLRERFRCVALTGLMLLRNPLGRRPRVGGQDWAERRLFDKVRAAEPDFVLLRQAVREVHEDCCDAEAARAFLDTLPHGAVRWRRLARVSPFAESWTQLAEGPGEVMESPADVLRRLHALLTRGATGHASAS